MGDMTMAGASTKSLENLHGDIIYITGGESDVAYANASLDYERIDNVPVVFAIIKRRGMEELLQKNMEVLSQKWLSIGSIGILKGMKIILKYFWKKICRLIRGGQWMQRILITKNQRYEN
jgi:hypothetical protein